VAQPAELSVQHVGPQARAEAGDTVVLTRHPPVILAACRLTGHANSAKCDSRNCVVLDRTPSCTASFVPIVKQVRQPFFGVQSPRDCAVWLTDIETDDYYFHVHVRLPIVRALDGGADRTNKTLPIQLSYATVTYMIDCAHM